MVDLLMLSFFIANYLLQCHIGCPCFVSSFFVCLKLFSPTISFTAISCRRPDFRLIRYSAGFFAACFFCAVSFQLFQLHWVPCFKDQEERVGFV